MSDVPRDHVTAVETLLREQVAELRADKETLRRLVEDLRAQVASLQQERAAVDPQEHTALLQRVELLAQRLEDKNAEVARLLEQNGEKDIEIARLQAVAASQLERVEAAADHIRPFSMAPLRLGMAPQDMQVMIEQAGMLAAVAELRALICGLRAELTKAHHPPGGRGDC